MLMWVSCYFERKWRTVAVLISDVGGSDCNQRDRERPSVAAASGCQLAWAEPLSVPGGRAGPAGAWTPQSPSRRRSL